MNTIAKLRETLSHSLPKEEHNALLKKEHELENELSEAIEKVIITHGQSYKLQKWPGRFGTAIE